METIHQRKNLFQSEKAKNELRSLTRKLREQFEMCIAQNNKISPKSFWSYVKSKTKTRAKIPSLKKADDTEAVTAYDKAETLNIYFSSSFTDERLDDVPSNSETTYLCEYLDTFLITPDMVIEKLKELKPDKSPGPDGWHPMFFKKYCRSYRLSSISALPNVIK